MDIWPNVLAEGKKNKQMNSVIKKKITIHITGRLELRQGEGREEKREIIRESARASERERRERASEVGRDRG